MSTLRRRKTWNQEKFTDDANSVWWVHKRETCAGSPCAIHNPSEHPLKDAPLVLRHGSPFSFKPHGFAERFCEHGIGHSDPDSVAFYSQHGDDGTGVHGCDGCCFGGFYTVQSRGEEEVSELEDNWGKPDTSLSKNWGPRDCAYPGADTCESGMCPVCCGDTPDVWGYDGDY